MNFEYYLSELFASFNHLRNNDYDFDLVINKVVECEGKIIVSGLGKTGIIGKKFSATLSSLGIPSVFLHCAEALHGDLGIISDKDLLILISQSGNSSEIVSLLRALKSFNNFVVGITSNTNSILGIGSDCILNLGVSNECSMHKYAPTLSTTVLLAALDFIALRASETLTKGILDFSKNHPGGNLGISMRGSIREFLVDASPFYVNIGVDIHELSFVMGSSGFGAALVLDNERIGIITDGDLRRSINKTSSFSQSLNESMVNWEPRIISDLDLDLIIREFDNSGVAFLLYIENKTVYFLRKF